MVSKGNKKKRRRRRKKRKKNLKQEKIFTNQISDKMFMPKI